MTAADLPHCSHGRRPRIAWRRPRHPLASLLVLAVAALAAMPVAGLIRIAARGDVDIWQHLVAYVLPAAVMDTALLLAGVAVVATLAGVGTAWLVTTFEFPGRNALVWLLPLPLAFPTYIVAYVYADMLDAAGPVQTALRAAFGWRTAADYWFPNIRSLGGAALVMGVVLYPYVYLAARAMFQTQSAALIEIARLLGATRWRLACDISLPMARPAIAAGLALALLETLNDIGACEYLGVQTLTLSIFTTWLNRGSLPGAAQIACAMLVAIAGLIVMERWGRGGRQFIGLDRHPRAAERIPLAGRAAWLATAACLTPVALGFALPFAVLAREAILRTLRNGLDPDLIGHAATTALFAASATALVLVLGFGAAMAVRLLRRPYALAAITIGGLGYAIPGAVLALGLLTPLVLIDDAFNWIARGLAGSGVGLIVAGSGAAVVTAYVIRFLAIATGFAQAGLARVPIELDDAARSLGAAPSAIVRIHLPLIRPALGGAALLVFVDSLKELPATLLLRPLNVETLSTYVYQFATRGSFEDGALAALLIVAVGVVPAIRMVHYADVAATPQRPVPLT